MTNKISTIQGGIARDQRGQVRFVNDFDMEVVKRFYIIKNANTEIIRGWRAHKIEQRWFYVLSGSIDVSVIRIDNWESASRNLSVEKVSLSAHDLKVLHVPNGYGTAFKSISLDAELLVFADSSIHEAWKDDYTWNLEYFKNL